MPARPGRRSCVRRPWLRRRARPRDPVPGPTELAAGSRPPRLRRPRPDPHWLSPIQVGSRRESVPRPDRAEAGPGLPPSRPARGRRIPTPPGRTALGLPTPRVRSTARPCQGKRRSSPAHDRRRSGPSRRPSSELRPGRLLQVLWPSPPGPAQIRVPRTPSRPRRARSSPGRRAQAPPKCRPEVPGPHPLVVVV